MARGALLALALAACGGASIGPGQASVDGTIDGATLSARSALSVTLFSSSDDGASAQVLLIQIGDHADDCTSPTYSAALHPDEEVLAFALTATTGSGQSVPPTAGAYAVVRGGVAPGNAALASYQRSDDHCGMLTSQTEPIGVSGTVTLAATTPAGASGRFDVTLAVGGTELGASARLTGAFDAITCDALALVAQNPAGAGCL